MNLDSIIEIVESNEDLIDFNYNGKDNQIFLHNRLKQEIVNFATRINNEEINKRELVKYALREALELSDTDIIIIRKDGVFVKLFDAVKRHEVTESEKNTIAGRYNGIDEDELQSFYNDIFLKEENKSFFSLVAKLFVEIYFLNKKIDNATYEKNVYPYILEIITEQLVNTFDHNDEFFKGFSGYIFRMHFKDVIGYIADLMLAEVSKSNDYMISYLKYYSLNIIVINGVKYKVPELEASNGLKWNVISMLSIVKIFIKTKTSIEIHKEDIYTIDEEIMRLYVNDKSPAEYQASILKEKDDIAEEITKDLRKLEATMDAYDISKDDTERKELEQEIKDIKHDLQFNRQKKTKISSKMVNKGTIDKYNNLKKELETVIKELKREERILSQNKQSYLSIKNALIKALTSKKQRL